jgi:hypothetical protein
MVNVLNVNVCVVEEGLGLDLSLSLQVLNLLNPVETQVQPFKVHQGFCKVIVLDGQCSQCQ